MLKTACFITGDNRNFVAADTPSSKKKIVAMATAIMVPVLIWVFNGFMLSFQVLKTNLGWSITTAIFCGTIVFIIEKLIIMSHGNVLLNLIRILIGLIVAFLGSIFIDEVIFKTDIDISVGLIKEKIVSETMKEEEKTFNQLNHIAELDSNIRLAQEKYDRAEISTINEADGSKGTGHIGVGTVARFKDQKAKERKMDLNDLLSEKNNLLIAKDSLIKASGIKAEASFHENALLTRIKALFALVMKDKYMLGTYILFTLLLFFFEFLVVILKITWEKTNYEMKLEMIEEIGKRRVAFLLRRDSPFSDPGNYLPEFDDARKAIKKDHSLYN